ncbi:MAG TPA: response regulator transcription factor [Chthoniobacterales bacterium]|jgi:DNA-binding NarL/FixJ family response regulator|nr:response regulator transcription factor [Chthoniobacterales bacterium]
MKTARALKEDPKPAAAKRRIVIVDDHPLFRKGLEQLINSSDHAFHVCGEATDAAEGMTVIRELKPDLAIVDLSLPGANGIELLKNVRAEFPKLPVLILSMHDESLYALRALRAGAQGYVMKQEALENVIVAIREVLSGKPYLSQDMSAKLITNFASGGDQSNPTDKLSDRELEILELIGKGRDVREIAKVLHISAKTVETHRAHIKEKLNLKNARQVTRFAVQWLEGQAT